MRKYKVQIAVYMPQVCNLGYMHRDIYVWKDLTGSNNRVIHFTKSEAEKYREVYGFSDPEKIKIIRL